MRHEVREELLHRAVPTSPPLSPVVANPARFSSCSDAERFGPLRRAASERPLQAIQRGTSSIDAQTRRALLPVTVWQSTIRESSAAVADATSWDGAPMTFDQMPLSCFHNRF